MPSTEIHGRFLPARVYNRWKWTVRFGLMLVPLMFFLAEGMVRQKKLEIPELGV